MKRFTLLLLLFVAVALYAFGQYRVSVRDNGGQLVYALDDAYIHMAIAKNLAEHGVWGVTRFGFSSSSSSILWPMLLALIYKIAGVSVLAPYVLNVVMTCLVVGLADAMLRGPIPSALGRLPAQVLLLLATPFPPLLASGMEHTLQIFVMLGFAWASACALANPDGSARAGAAPWMFVSAFFVAFVRYESALMALVVCCLLFARRRYFQAFALGVIVLLPVIAYGLISLQHGWFFLPNPILLKSDFLDASQGSLLAKLFSRSDSFYWRLLATPHLFVPALLAGFLFILRAERAGLWERWQLLLLLSAAGTMLHLQFADRGWFYRYEAYLMAVGIVATAGAGAEFAALLRRPFAGEAGGRLKGAGVALFGLFMLIPACYQGLKAWTDAPKAMHDRYLEHIKPVEFIQRYYAAEPVMVNDIGALCFFTDMRVLDVFGLGNMESGRYKVESRGFSGMTSEKAKAWAEREGVPLAVIQLEWRTIRYVVPNEWVLVGIWEIPRNVIFPDKLNIGWFATSADEAARLAGHLKAFFPEVPSTVRQHGLYLGDTMEEMSALIAEREERR